MTGVLPLEIMLTVMRENWKGRVDDKAAVALARAAAPYVHPRAGVVRRPSELSEVPDDELDQWTGGDGEAAAAADPE